MAEGTKIVGAEPPEAAKLIRGFAIGFHLPCGTSSVEFFRLAVVARFIPQRDKPPRSDRAAASHISSGVIIFTVNRDLRQSIRHTAARLCQRR